MSFKWQHTSSQLKYSIRCLERKPKKRYYILSYVAFFHGFLFLSIWCACQLAKLLLSSFSWSTESGPGSPSLKHIQQNSSVTFPYLVTVEKFYRKIWWYYTKKFEHFIRYIKENTDWNDGNSITAIMNQRNINCKLASFILCSSIMWINNGSTQLIKYISIK